MDLFLSPTQVYDKRTFVFENVSVDLSSLPACLKIVGVKQQDQSEFIIDYVNYNNVTQVLTVDIEANRLEANAEFKVKLFY
jgi:hypothetical protein